ncbi:MAG TPA: GNAT family protein [Pseudonocardiaceae bacterium]|nr:GNAT family protein [Pseudonocardiaceae bacterium]
MRECLSTSSGLVLRPWVDGDVPALLVAYEPAEMRKEHSGPPIDTPSAALNWLRIRRAAWEAGSGYAFAVTDARDTVLGCMAVTAIDRRHDIGWVSYWTMAAARGRGVAGAAARAVSEWAFADLGLFRLELGHRTDNVASCRVAMAAGYAVEGLERAKLRYGDRRYDAEIHARLATDPSP